jgi:hypothetical protein
MTKKSIDNDGKNNIVTDSASADLGAMVVRSSAPIRHQKAKPPWLDLNTGR